MLKEIIKRSLNAVGLDVRRYRKPIPRQTFAIPDAELYLPVYSPWLSEEFKRRYDRITPYTLVTRESCYVLQTLACKTA
jgi:hypothetical protein